MKIYLHRGWQKIEDNINFTVSRLYYNLGHVIQALEYVERILCNRKERLLDFHESNIVKDYMFYFNKTIHEPNGIKNLIVPIFDLQNSTVEHRSNENLVLNFKISSISMNNKEENRGLWQKLEETLIREDNKLLSNSLLLQNGTLLSSYMENLSNLECCVEEKIYVTVGVKNPLKMPVLLSDLKLIWNFRTNTNNYHNDSFCNAEKFIYDSCISEFLLQPLAFQTLQFWIESKAEGLFTITGLSYGLKTILNVETNESGYLISGKQDLKVKSQNTHQTQRIGSTSVTKSLNIRCIKKMPLMQASFENFPETILNGEVISFYIELTNISDLPLKNIKMACSYPNLMIDINETQVEIIFSSKKITETNNGFDIDDNLSNKIFACKLNSLILKPCSKYRVKMWFKAPFDFKISERIIHFLFYYENALLDNTTNAMKYKSI